MSAFIDERRDLFGVEFLCRTLGVSASAYYKRATGERSVRRIEDERLTELIREVHRTNYEAYGACGCGKHSAAVVRAPGVTTSNG